MPSPHEHRVELRILERLAGDRARGDLGAVERYLAEFPDSPDVVARCFAEFASSADFADDPLRRVGRFELVRALGQGGQGRVYLARCERDDIEVALKILPGVAEHPASGPTREREVFARLDDARIAGIVDTGVHAGSAWIATRYVPGESLASLLAHWRTLGDGAPPLFERVGIVAEIASALGVAHAHGVVHRDVKPSNVIVPTLGPPVLIDFGLSRVIDSALPSLTRTGDVLGTPPYLSPERLRGEGRDDPRADVWALGVTLFQCVTFDLPFQGASIQSIARAIERDEPPSLRRRMRGTSTVSIRDRRLLRDLDAVLATALEKRIARRYPDADALAADLQRALCGEVVSVPAPSIWSRARRWSAHNRAAAGLIALLAATTVAAAIVAIVFGRLVDNERRARHEALVNLASAEAEGGRLEFESLRLGRAGAALARFEKSSAAIARLSAIGVADAGALTVDVVAMRTVASSALCAWDLEPIDGPDAGGFGSVNATPDASTVVFYGVSRADRSVQITATDVQSGATRALPAKLAEVHGALCAVGPGLGALAFVARDILTLVRLEHGESLGSPVSIPLELRRVPGHVDAESRRRVDAKFDSRGEFLLLACEDDFGGRWYAIEVAQGRVVRTDVWDGATPAWCGVSLDDGVVVVPGGSASRALVRLVRLADVGDDVEIEVESSGVVLAAVPLDDDNIAYVGCDGARAWLRWAGPACGARIACPIDLVAVLDGEVARVSVSPDRRLLSLAIRDRVVMYDLHEDAIALTGAVPTSGAVELCAFERRSDDGELRLLHHCRGGRIARYRAVRRVELRESIEWREPPIDREVLVARVIRSETGSSGADLPTMQFVDTASGTAIEFVTEGLPFTVGGQSQVGPWVAARLTWLTDRDLRATGVVIDARDLSVAFERDVEGTGHGGAIAVSDDGALLADVTDRGELTLFDVAGGVEILRLSNLGGGITHLRFEPSGDLIVWFATGVPRRIRLAALRASLRECGLGWSR